MKEITVTLKYCDQTKNTFRYSPLPTDDKFKETDRFYFQKKAVLEPGETDPPEFLIFTVKSVDQKS